MEETEHSSPSSVEAFASNELFARVLLSLATEPGDPVGGKLIRRLGAVETVRRALRTTADDGHGPEERWLRRACRGFDVDAASEVFDGPIRDDTQLVIPGDPAWPSGINAMDDYAPWAMWITGDARHVQASEGGPNVVVTGTRRSSFLGTLIANQMAEDLTRGGCRVLLTGQAGIGAGAAAGMLRAGGRPIVVLPTTHTCPAPDPDHDGFDLLSSTGVILSEFGKPHERKDFRPLQRDRILVALADAVVVIEAARDSECMDTAYWANDVAVPVGVIPAIPGETSADGCARLLTDDVAQPVSNAQDVASPLDLTWGQDGRARAHQSTRTVGVDR